MIGHLVRSMMSMFKSLGRLILGGEEQKEIFRLPEGSFWRLETKRSVINRTQVHEKASLTLERKMEAPFEFVLCVTKFGQESGHSDSLPKSGDRDEFNLTVASGFVRSYSEEGEAVFMWKEASQDKVLFEFVVNVLTTAATIEMFHFAVAQCIFSNKERRPFGEASDKEIQQWIIVAQDEDEEQASQKVEGARLDEGEIVSFKSDLALFYVFDPNTGIFMPKGEGESFRAVITVGGNKNTQYLNIMADKDSAIHHRQRIDPDATLHTDRKSSSFIWCYFSSEGHPWTFSLRFGDPVGLMGMSNALGQAIYEILNEAKLADEDRSYFMNQLTEDVEMTDARNEPYISDSDDGLEASTREDAEDYEETDDDQDESDQDMPQGVSAETNRQLAVGYKHDRSFVSHGHSMSVFKHTADDTIQLYANIDKMQTRAGRMLAPTRMMLHEEDRAMILMDGEDPGKLYKMDLEYGKVVEDWQVNPEGVTTAINAILPDSKYAQMTSNPTLIGLSDNALFRIDPRLPGSKRVESEMKQYVVKNNFTCGATTGTGELAVASAKGELRLFNKLDKRAKTLLPGFGDPISGVDVTESGRWVIATCKTYLLLITTEIAGEEALGFSKPMGSKKPAPKRLQLKPEHIAYMNAPVSFTPARFSTGRSEERSIITSTGPYVITWNLRRVKQGHLWDYQIRKYQDKVVADNFRYGQDRSIVVTLPHHVTMISKKSLATPSIDVFRKKGTARDDIVQDYK